MKNPRINDNISWYTVYYTKVVMRRIKEIIKKRVYLFTEVDKGKNMLPKKPIEYDSVRS